MLDVVRLVINLFVVMTSLVLGLLINTAKNRFDAINREVHMFATDLILLDRMLQLYGDDAGETRQRLVAYVDRAAKYGLSSPTNSRKRASKRASNRLSQPVCGTARGFSWPSAARRICS